MTNNLSKKTYRELKEALEETLAKLQSEDMDIDEAIVLHKKGQEILKQMQDYLEEVTNKIKPTIKK